MSENFTILYLEDEPIVAIDTGAHLESLDMGVVEVAYRLKKAESIASTRKIDLAILDINVDRGQTSIALGKELAASGTKVIFASGNSGDAPALEAEGFGFLDKPFSLSALTRKIEASCACNLAGDG